MNLRQIPALATALLLTLVGSAFGGNIFVLPPEGNETLGVRGFTELLAPMGTVSPPAGIVQVLSTHRGDKAIFLADNPAAAVSFVNITGGQLAADVRTRNLNGLGAIKGVLSPDGERLYVIAGSAAGAFFIIDLVSETVVNPGGLNVGGAPREFVVSPDGQYAYVLNSLNQIAVINLQTGAVVAQPGNMGTLNTVGISPTGRVFVAGQNQLMEFSARPPFVRVAFTSLPAATSPSRLAFSPSGRYILALSSQRVQVLDLTVPGSNTQPGVPPSARLVSDAVLALTTPPAPVPDGSFVVLSETKALVYVASQGRILELDYPNLQVREAFFAGGVGTLSGVTGLAVSNEYPAPRTMFYTQGDQLRLYNLTTGSQTNTAHTGGGPLRYAPASSMAPASEIIAYGDGQIAGPNVRLQPYAVRVVDANRRPVIGAQVTFSSAVSGVQLSATAAVTNVDGIATVVVTSSPAVNGEFIVQAAVAGITRNLISTVTGGTGGGGPGEPGPSGPSIIKVSGDGQLTQSGTGSPGTRPMVIRVVDSDGQPIPDVAVTWSVSAGLAPVSLPNQVTDENGESSMFWGASGSLQIGVPFAEHTITASSAHGSVTFLATSYPQNAAGLQPHPTIAVLSPPQDNRALTVRLGQPLDNGVRVSVVTGGGQGVSPGMPIPNVGVRIFTPFSDPSQGPVASCEGGVVFTDELGQANCKVLASGMPGVTTLTVDVGGGHLLFPAAIQLTVLPGDPGQPVITQGNNQSGAPGALLPQVLVARITDSAGNILPGTTANWEIVTPGTLTLAAPTTTVANASGLVSTRVQLGTTIGTHQIRLRVGENSVLFSLTVVAPIGNAVILSGNNQTGTVIGQQFPSPLIVRVTNTQGEPISNLSVAWAVASGSAELSAASTVTGANGQASVNVTAGDIPGAISVTATVPGQPVLTFSLSSRLPGPSLAVASFRNAASNELGITPGGLVRVSGQGLAPGITGELNASLLGGRLPFELAGVSVEFTASGVSAYAPIYQVANVEGFQSILIQVPFGLQGATASATVTVQGGMTTVEDITLLPVSPGVLEDHFPDGRWAAVVIREDGLVVTPATPARRGETLRMYAIGLGQTTPTADTNRVGMPGQFVLANLAVGIDNAGVEVVSAKLAENLIGVYEIIFVVPATATIGPDRPLGFVMEVVPGEPIYANGSIIAIGEE